eukprot:4595962-Amphidinium_carterae.2
MLNEVFQTYSTSVPKAHSNSNRAILPGRLRPPDLRVLTKLAIRVTSCLHELKALGFTNQHAVAICGCKVPPIR